MEASFENLKAIISERNGLIEFVTCEAEEKKKQVDDIAKALSTEQTFVNIMIYLLSPNFMKNFMY